METFLKQYAVRIRTCGPVYIGAGKQISKKEYLFDQRSGHISVVDIDRMYADLSRRKLTAAFEAYLLNPAENSLYNFVRANGINMRDTDSWVKYTLPTGDPDQNVHSVKNIDCFIKDAYGRPYIPGSSIKGMLRTMIEAVWFREHPEEQQAMQNDIRTAYRIQERRQKYLAREERSMAEASFHEDLYPDENGRPVLRDLKNDVMRGLIVSDSEPIEYNDMTLCQKIDMRPDGTYKALNAMRECIRPGVEIRFTLTIDPSVFPYSFSDLMEINRKFYRFYQEVCINRFKNPVSTHGNSTTFFLGGGAGYATKTDTYSVLDDSLAVEIVSAIINSTLPEKVRQRHGHEKDVSYGVSPHTLKCTKYQGNYYQMGACCLMKYHEVTQAAE